MKPDKKKIILIGGVILTLLIISIVLISSGRISEETEEESELLPTEVVIPTVDANAGVDLVASASGREVTLQVKKLPKGTETVDYELSYQTASQGLQGVIGTVEIKSGQSSIDKTLTLGTCSSGTCIYHQVVGKIRANLRFTGSYGDKVYEKEYEI
ncbi:hypothetical protein A2774_01765 [Candidatus Roizmanbacteria bacterium RIFCSPHIGHO2_01_FULL_39_12c]|uniref:Uncharacterized protein n=1 Tax=Candidatus Roizmanbacteria bacterium RIFCSPHIGHO2_01_FULL_39_12c TaxID=1802031 RepID=A0A1F7GB05_9BACT|nr:MAG: hypothetical protein A2774_01765 [Candidatus Roizmanbacteria bacterium RIFCSPHIGHO2_01_FULL_39_12c]OGK46919.1 MAG: hypothetical protein A2963_05175 [Candidatus Roizmanbacteria bacterium RIFCSPLOWO2_01_FULL_40_13]